jgi:hypothetical protein
MDWNKLAHQHECFRCQVGSRARNLHITQEDLDNGYQGKLSDEDWRGLFALPQDYYFTLEDVPDFVNGTLSDDHQIMNIMVYIKRLYKSSNAELLEYLWSSNQETYTPHARLLVSFRHKFANMHIVRRLLAGAGWIESDVINAMVSENKTLPKESGLFGRGIKYINIDPIESNKSFSDVIRRLFVAKHMLLPMSDTTKNLLTVENDIYWYDLRHVFRYSWDIAQEDGELVMVLPDEERNMVKNIRLGLTDFETITNLRNSLFDEVISLMKVSKLRQEPAPYYYNKCMQYFSLIDA